MSPGLKCSDLALLLMYAQGTETQSKLYKFVWMFIKIAFWLSDVPLSLSSCHSVHSMFIYLHHHMVFHVWNFFCITQNTFFNPSLLFPILYTLKVILFETHLHPFSRQLILETGGRCKDGNTRVKILALLHLKGVIISILEQFSFSVSHLPQL